MHDVITIGSATVDIFMKSAEFHLQPSQEGLLLCQEYGGKMDIQNFRMSTGGAGTNTAVGFRRMGFKTAAVVEIGKDILGQMIWDELKREHVDTDFIVTEKSEDTAVSVILISGDGGRSALTHRGAASQLEARDVPWEMLNTTRWVHLSNVGGDTELLFTLFDHLRHTLVGVSWNPGRKELELLSTGKMVIEQVVADILLMNKEEWEILKPVQERIIQHIPTVVITNGKEGGQLFTQGSYSSDYKPMIVPVTQETGAGDAFAVGFVSAHLSGLDPLACCSWGVHNSSNVIQHMDAKQGLLTKDQMVSRIVEGKN